MAGRFLLHLSVILFSLGVGVAQPFDVDVPVDQSQVQEAVERAAINQAGLVFDFNKARAENAAIAYGSAGSAVQGQGAQNPLLNTLPGPGASQNLLTLAPCATNQVHVHPRATELMFHLTGGTLEVGLVEENGGNNTLHLSKLPLNATFNIPQGIMHWLYNPNCIPASTLNTFNDKDPGTQGIFTSLVKVPSKILAASSGVHEGLWNDIKEAGLPLRGPSAGGAECLRRCNLTFAEANGLTGAALQRAKDRGYATAGLVPHPTDVGLGPAPPAPGVMG